MNTDTNKPYLIIKDKSGKLVGKKPEMEKPDENNFYEYNPEGPAPVIGFDLDRFKAYCAEYEAHIESLPSLHLDPSIKGKEGDRVEGVEVEQIFLSYGQGSRWYNVDEVDLNNFDPAPRRIILKAVAEKEMFINRAIYDHPDQSQEAQRQGAEEIFNKHVGMDWHSIRSMSQLRIKSIAAMEEYASLTGDQAGRWVNGDLSNEQLLKVLKGVSLFDLSDCTFDFGNEDGKHWCNAENDSVIDSIYWDGNLFWMMNNNDSFSPLNPQKQAHDILSPSPSEPLREALAEIMGIINETGYDSGSMPHKYSKIEAIARKALSTIK